MIVRHLQIEGLILLTPQIFSDERGHFFEVLRKQELREIGIENDLLQLNQSYSVKNVIRGLHFQSPPKAQGKLIRVLQGRIIDVAVDIRPYSATFLQWTSVILSSDIPQLFWIPRGFAHGFGVLSDTALVEYQCDEYFTPEHDRGILYSDKQLGINWNIDHPVLSEKDKKLPIIADIDFSNPGEK